MRSSPRQASIRRRAPALHRRLVFLVLLAVGPIGAQSRDEQLRRELGDLLFHDTAFSNPGADHSVSCATCHARGDDPKGNGELWYTDGTATSLLPQPGDGGKKTTLRNTPTLIDVELQSSFGWDGGAGDLPEYLRHKLLGAHFGWRPQDAERAAETLLFNLTSGADGRYVELFRRIYRTDLESVDAGEATMALARAAAEHVRSLRSLHTSTWDAFADINRIPKGPSSSETPAEYAGRIFGRIGNQEGRVLIKRPRGFSPEAYEGFKIFFRVEGETSVGNCVACHVPPAFSDHSLHNTGISQLQYDAVHGAGAFAAMAADGAALAAARECKPDADDPACVDLGAGLDASGAIDGARLGSFKTPTLRNLPRTAPFMHDGGAADIAAAVARIVEVSRLARAGTATGVDAEVAKVRLSAADIAPLIAFLKTLDEVPEAEFRELLLHFE